MTRTALALCLLYTLGAATSPAIAEPYEDNPSAATRDADYAAGKAAIGKKEWAEAVRRFQLAQRRDPDSADLHNYLGYSYRNLGQMDLAVQHYKRSIELNPRHRGAHEYLGEAYLMLNDLPNAQKHLAALRSICLLPCEELSDLEKAVEAFRAR
jgi:Flp pilus assembly protein TadD